MSEPNRPLRVAFISEHYPPTDGGVATSTQRVARNLQRLGANVHVLCFDHNRPMTSADYVMSEMDESVRVSRVGPFFLKQPEGDLDVPSHILRAAAQSYAKRFEDHFDLPNVVDRIVYSKGPVPGFAAGAFDVAHAIYDGKTALRADAAARYADLPFVLSYHGGFHVHAKIVDPRYREASRIVTERAAAVTVPAHADVQRLRAIGVRSPIEVVPVPVDGSDSPERPLSTHYGSCWWGG